jgi:hypothetical protein
MSARMAGVAAGLGVTRRLHLAAGPMRQFDLPRGESRLVVEGLATVVGVVAIVRLSVTANGIDRMYDVDDGWGHRRPVKNLAMSAVSVSGCSTAAK